MCAGSMATPGLYIKLSWGLSLKKILSESEKRGQGGSHLIGNTVYQFKRGRRRGVTIKAPEIKDHSGRVPSMQPELHSYRLENAQDV